MNLYSIGITGSLLLIIFFLTVLISVQLFRSKSGILLSNKLLGILFSLLSLQMLVVYLTVTKVLVKPIFIILDDSLLLGVGPLLYFYSRTNLDTSRKPDLTDLLHFIPLIILLVPSIFLLMTSTNYSEQLIRIDVTNSIRQISDSGFQWISFAMVTHVNLYLISAFLLARKFKPKVSYNYQWVMFCLVSFQILSIASYLQIFKPLFWGFPLSFFLMIAMLLVFLVLVILKGMDGSPLFSKHEKMKYENSKLNEKEKEIIQGGLKRMLDGDQVYLDADITVDKLAKTLKTHPKKLSQVINESFNKSFYDLINQHRIDHAMKLLDSSTEKTISEVQYSSGFNSKSSFHTQFRKRTGVSPREYKTKIQ